MSADSPGVSGNPPGPVLLFRTNTWSACMPFDPCIVMNTILRDGSDLGVTVSVLPSGQGIHWNPPPSRDTTS